MIPYGVLDIWMRCRGARVRWEYSIEGNGRGRVGGWCWTRERGSLVKGRGMSCSVRYTVSMQRTLTAIALACRTAGSIIARRYSPWGVHTHPPPFSSSSRFRHFEGVL